MGSPGGLTATGALQVTPRSCERENHSRQSPGPPATHASSASPFAGSISTEGAPDSAPGTNAEERKKYQEAKEIRARDRKLLAQVKKQIRYLKGALRGREAI